MSEQLQEGQDAEITALFESVSPQLADHGFTARVIHRIKRRLWIRRIATGLAVAIALPLLVTVVAAMTGTGDGSSEEWLPWTVWAQDPTLAMSMLLLGLPLLAEAVRD